MIGIVSYGLNVFIIVGTTQPIVLFNFINIKFSCLIKIKVGGGDSGGCYPHFSVYPSSHER